MLISAMRRLSLPIVLMLALVSCSGGAAQDPKDQLIDAFRALGDLPGITITVTLDTDEASLEALTAEQDAPGEVLALLRNAALRISVPTDPEAKAAEFALMIDGTEHAGLRFIDNTLYLRADVAAIMQAAGEDPAQLEGFKAMLTGSGMLPPDVLEGRWIAIRGVEELAKQFSGDASESPNPLDQTKAREAMDRLANVLIDQATITRAGSDADGDHLVAVAPLRAMYAAVRDEVKALGLPAGSDDMPDPSEIPDESVTVDLWVKDGRLSAVALDVRQLAALDPDAEPLPEGVERLNVHLRFEPFDGKVAVPDDAVDFDPMQIMQMFMGAMGGMGDAMSEGGMPPGMPEGFGDMGPGEMPPGFEEFMEQHGDGSS